MVRCRVEVTWHTDGQGATVTLIRHVDGRLDSMHTRDARPGEDLVAHAFSEWAVEFGNQETLPFF